jgi:hypothetical protein
MEAVRRFQLARGVLPANGIVEAATERALLELKQQNNPRLYAPAAPVADWFQRGAQRVVEQRESAPESVPLRLSDGRTFSVEQALQFMNDEFVSTRGREPADPDDPCDLAVTAANRHATNRKRKGYWTVEDRKVLGGALKEAFEALAGVQILAVEAPSAPAVQWG